MPAQPTTHPSVDTLLAWGQQKLEAQLARDILEHLDSCDVCRKVVSSLSGEDSIDRLRAAKMPAGTPAPDGSNASQDESLPTIDISPATLFGVPPELAHHAQYEVMRELGRGGMGVVYLARNRMMDRLEVLKLMNKSVVDNPEAADRFLREIRSAAKLSHKNVVSAYHALRVGDLIVFTMEYVEGEDLTAVVKSKGPLPVIHACYYVQQTAQGLQHAFEKGMIHRDINPRNLILSVEGKKHTVKILDFGLAKASREGKVDTELTGMGKMLGTPDYIAPEQALNASTADIRADIYSLGCTLYYLLTGTAPFKGNSLYEILQAHQSKEARPLSEFRSDVSPGLAQVVAKMMAKEPSDRYQKPIEVSQALMPFLKTPAVTLQPANVPAKSTAIMSARAKDFSNSLGMKFKWIEPGSFLMGSPATELERGSDETQRRVKLTKGYYMGVHLVTQAQWEAVLGNEANRSHFKATTDISKKQLPVDSVSWEDCQEFCQRLSHLEKRKYYLPSEAEWENACRAATTTPFWCGATISTDQANYDGTSSYGLGSIGAARKRPTPANKFKPNPWGLFDMHGNLWQWCEDYYAAYSVDDLEDPVRLDPGEQDIRVVRGGCWDSLAKHCRAACRHWYAPNLRSNLYGCRVLYSPD